MSLPLEGNHLSRTNSNWLRVDSGRSFSAAALIGVVFLSTAMALVCLYGDWRWTLICLAGLLFLFVVAVHGTPHAIMLLLVLRPVVDTFVYTPVGFLTLGQVWGTILAALMIYGLAVKQIAPPSLRKDAPLLVFLFLSLIALLRAPGLTGISDYIRFAVWLLLVPALGSGSHDAISGNTILRCGRLLMLGSILAAWLVLVLNRYGLAYYTGGFDAENQGPHGISLLVVLSLVFVASFTGQALRKAAVIFAALGGVLGSFVRSTSIAGIMVAAAATLILTPTKRARWYATVLFFSLVILVIGMPYMPMFFNRFSNLALLWTPDYFEAGSGRVAIWSVYMSTVQREGPWGWIVGLGADSVRRGVESKLGIAFFAHSDPLEFLVAGGLPFLISYLGVLLWLARWPLKATHATDPMLRRFGQLATVAVIGYAVVSFLNGAFFYQASVALALSVAYCRKTSEESVSDTGLTS